MGAEASNGPARQRHAEDLLAAVSMTSSQFAQAIGRFDGDTPAMVTAAIHTAGRAFSELDACNDVIDDASETGRAIADRLCALLSTGAVEDVALELEALEAVSARVRGTDQTRLLLHRVLGREASAKRALPGVRHLSGADLPYLPSSYQDEQGFDDLVAMAAREDELAPRLREAHAERLDKVAAHLVRVVEQAAAVGFADEVFAQESVREARHAYELWVQCLKERGRDLG
ncbi:hypothetical protein [Streptomyces durocortorensis]|uniref:Uncharacterized protein n=1 Tax=Streptomyces durocortorensis TaxID=2811104 RepID=A0ABS2I6F8_9ACTN|nr:hypothetical protein [Streptomyces durocortorensis]MBM7057824.1 hypothetical protein [Streptomyces durocortorensis]